MKFQFYDTWFLQLMFWLDIMTGTEIFSMGTFIGAILAYLWLRVTVK